MIVERSFGIIPIRKNGDILLIQDIHGNWGFPKGHPEGLETPEQSAQRELFEETGLKVLKWIQSPKIEITYKRKLVQFFPALVTENISLQAEEIQNHAWLSRDLLEDKITFAESKEIVKWIPTLTN